MKKMYFIGLLLPLLFTLCACGAENYTRGWCMREVTQKPHTVKNLGQEMKVCDSCYKMLSAYAAQID